MWQHIPNGAQAGVVVGVVRVVVVLRVLVVVGLLVDVRLTDRYVEVGVSGTGAVGATPTVMFADPAPC